VDLSVLWSCIGTAGAGAPAWETWRGSLRLNLSPDRALLRSALGREAFGDEWIVRRGVRDIRRRSGPFFLDLGEQPHPYRGGRPILLQVIVGEKAGLEDYGAQLGDAAATSVVEVHKGKAGPGHRILQQRDRRCPRQAMLAAQMQKSADKAVAAVSIVIGATRPVAVGGTQSSIRSSNCTALVGCATRTTLYDETGG